MNIYFSLLSLFFRMFLRRSLARNQWIGQTATLSMYGGKSDDKWKKLTSDILNSKIESESIESINELLRSFAENNMTLDTFWGPFFETKVDIKISNEKIQLSSLIDLVNICNSVEYRPEQVLSKLVAMLLTNETIWVISPKDLVEVARVISESRTEHKQLFTEIAARVRLEPDFEIDDLVSLMESFGRINFSNKEMFDKVLAKIIKETHKTDILTKIRLATVCSILRVRSDTLFKFLVQDTPPVHAAEVCVAMKKLKMHTGSTSWWDREKDFIKLKEMADRCFTIEAINSMTANQLEIRTQVAGSKHAKEVIRRMKDLLTNFAISKSHKQLAKIMDNISRKSPSSCEQDVRGIAEWLCSNVYILPVADIASINRSITKLGFRDHSYHKIWVTYYLERLDELDKNDITTISDNFNTIGMTDKLLGGRHFFYKLGKRFQDLTVEQSGDKELNTNMKYRNLLQRLG